MDKQQDKNWENQNFFVRYAKKYIDFRMGLAGAVVMAIIVFIINFDRGGWFWASIAALKQGSYTFLFGGVIMRMSELLSVNIKAKTKALIAACVLPSILSLTLTFGMHSLKGTPKPVQSTIPTAIFVIPSTAVWGVINRRKKDKKLQTKSATI